MLAHLLGLSGIRTLVLEREAGSYPLPRAIVFDDEIMRVFQWIGIADELEPLTAPHPGSEYLIKDGDTGLMAPPDKAGELIARALRDAAAREAIVRRARGFAKRFAPATVASSYLDLYRMAQARTAGAP